MIYNFNGTQININKEFRITFQPKAGDEGKFNGRKRFSVGAGQLHKYIGQDNAEIAIRAALEAGEDRFRKKFRVAGWVDFYSCK